MSFWKKYLLFFHPSVEHSAMDLVLDIADYYVLTPYVYPASWAEDGALRQILSLLVLTNLGAAVLYLGLGAISYFFVFDHNLKKHPHFLEVQKRAWPRSLVVSSESDHRYFLCVFVPCRIKCRGRLNTPWHPCRGSASPQWRCSLLKSEDTANCTTILTIIHWVSQWEMKNPGMSDNLLGECTRW